MDKVLRIWTCYEHKYQGSEGTNEPDCPCSSPKYYPLPLPLARDPILAQYNALVALCLPHSLSRDGGTALSYGEALPCSS